MLWSGWLIVWNNLDLSHFFCLLLIQSFRGWFHKALSQLINGILLWSRAKLFNLLVDVFFNQFPLAWNVGRLHFLRLLIDGHCWDVSLENDLLVILIRESFLPVYHRRSLRFLVYPSNHLLDALRVLRVDVELEFLLITHNSQRAFALESLLLLWIGACAHLRLQQPSLSSCLSFSFLLSCCLFPGCFSFGFHFLKPLCKCIQSFAHISKFKMCSSLRAGVSGLGCFVIVHKVALVVK